MMASLTSDYTGANSTSHTWFGYHAKGSGSADAVDRESGVIGGTSAVGVYYRYATGFGDYLVEMQYLSDRTWQNAWASGSSSGESQERFAEVARGDRRYLDEEAGVFAETRVAGLYESWSKRNDSIDYVGQSRRHSHTESQMADGTAMTWTYDNEFRYTGVGEFRDGAGDSGGFRPDGETGLDYSGFADTLTTTFASETTFHATTAVPTRTFSYPMGSMTYTYTQPGWSSWSKSRWTTVSEATYDAQAIAWRRYSPTESSSGSSSEEGEDATDAFTWLWQHSYTGPAGHLFEQSFGGTTTITHTSTTTGAPPTDPAVIAAMTAIANQSVGESAAGGQEALYSISGQGVGGSDGDGGNGVVAAKDLNLAEFFAQAAAQPTWQSAGQSASKFAGQIAGQFARQIVGQSAGERGSSVSDEPSDLPARHPDSAMPESWLDVLDALKDRVKTAYDHPDQRPALTDAAFAELTALDAPENPGTPIMQAFGADGGSRGPTGGGPVYQPLWSPPDANTDPVGYFNWFAFPRPMEERIFGPLAVDHSSVRARLFSRTPSRLDLLPTLDRLVVFSNHVHVPLQAGHCDAWADAFIAAAPKSDAYKLEKAIWTYPMPGIDQLRDLGLWLAFGTPPGDVRLRHVAVKVTFSNGYVCYFDDGWWGGWGLSSLFYESDIPWYVRPGP